MDTEGEVTGRRLPSPAQSAANTLAVVGGEVGVGGAGRHRRWRWGRTRGCGRGKRGEKHRGEARREPKCGVDGSGGAMRWCVGRHHSPEVEVRREGEEWERGDARRRGGGDGTTGRRRSGGRRARTKGRKRRGKGGRGEAGAEREGGTEGRAEGSEGGRQEGRKQGRTGREAGNEGRGERRKQSRKDEGGEATAGPRRKLYGCGVRFASPSPARLPDFARNWFGQNVPQAAWASKRGQSNPARPFCPSPLDSPFSELPAKTQQLVTV